jgi:biotin operon repressor
MAKTYTKVHTSEKALKDHSKKLKKRGAEIEKVKTKNATKLFYKF